VVVVVVGGGLIRTPLPEPKPNLLSCLICRLDPTRTSVSLAAGCYGLNQISSQIHTRARRSHIPAPPQRAANPASRSDAGLGGCKLWTLTSDPSPLLILVTLPLVVCTLGSLRRARSILSRLAAMDAQFRNCNRRSTQHQVRPHIYIHKYTHTHTYIYIYIHIYIYTYIDWLLWTLGSGIAIGAAFSTKYALIYIYLHTHTYIYIYIYIHIYIYIYRHI